MWQERNVWEKSMKREVGLWIDHRKAVIVSFTDNGKEACLIESDMDQHVRYSGATQEDSAEDQRASAQSPSQPPTPFLVIDGHPNSLSRITFPPFDLNLTFTVSAS
jgi:hypothetical protein